MKSILTIALILIASSSFGQAPATPAPSTPRPAAATPPPVATPAPTPLTIPAAPPTLLTAHAFIPTAQLLANLNAVPATPQSLLQLLLTFLPLPTGVTPDKIKSESLNFTPTGASVTVQYITP